MHVSIRLCVMHNDNRRAVCIQIELEMETYHPILVITINQNGQLALRGYGSKIGCGEGQVMWSYGVPGVVSVTQSHRRRELFDI